MIVNHPFQVIGYHSCDRSLGLEILNGKKDLIPSNNDWDWLGDGVYFWEQDPMRAINYSVEVANRKQFSKGKITDPFILGAVINLGHCLNLIESESLSLLEVAHQGLVAANTAYNIPMPINDGAKRNLDCAVIRYIHQFQKETGKPHYDTVRSSFDEGKKVYEGASFTSRHHIQICVRNLSMIQGYFLPRPLEKFNPYLIKDYSASKSSSHS